MSSSIISNLASDVDSVFSDDNTEANNRFKQVSELVHAGKKALKAGPGLLELKRKLVKNINVLSETNEKSTPKLNPENEYQNMVLDQWIEELVRFLALKTITGDYTEPCQLLPGYAVGLAWKVLMTSPSLYSKICTSMGNQTVFDHHPEDSVSSRVQEKHRVKRYNATLRVYENYFDQQPQPLYWSFHAKEKEEESAMKEFMSNFCGCDVLSDTMSSKKSRPMSPSMPLSV